MLRRWLTVPYHEYQFGGGQGTRVELYRVNFFIGSDNRKYCSDHIIGCISFDNDQGLGNLV